MKCTVCGMENKQESVFCVNCGSKLAEPVKRKKPLYKKKWFWVLMSIATSLHLIISLIFIAAVGSVDLETTGYSGKTATKAPSVSASASASTTAHHKMNETIIDVFGIEYTITNVYSCKRIGAMRTDNIFVVITVKIKNTMGLTHFINRSDFKYLVGGSLLHSYAPSEAGRNLSNGLWNSIQLDSYLTKTVQIAFEVPVDYDETDCIVFGSYGSFNERSIYLHK